MRLSGVTKSFGRVEVLRGVDLQVPARALTAILGPSGCGKTTLLRLVACFDWPDSGTIAIGERTVCNGRRGLPPERRGIGHVAQEGALFPHLNVAANITFGLPWRTRRPRSRVDELLELMGMQAAYATRYPHQLSGGQQRRVALARALAAGPPVVLLDEPFSALDAGLRADTRRAVTAALRATGTTAVLVTHDQGEELSMADRIAVMREGRLVQTAAPADVYSAPTDLGVAGFVGDSVVLPGTVGPGTVGPGTGGPGRPSACSARYRSGTPSRAKRAPTRDRCGSLRPPRLGRDHDRRTAAPGLRLGADARSA